MIRTFRYPLNATRRQLAMLDDWRVRCCELYNAALEQRIASWRQHRRGVTRYDQHKELTELRAADAEYAAMPVETCRSALNRLDRAFQAFFRRLKSGATPGFPRFRSRHRYVSFGLGRVRVEDGRVQIPRLGWVRYNEYRPLKGAVRNVEIRRTAKRWWLCVACDVGVVPPKRTVRIDRITGVDVGLTHFATLADGSRVANPRHYRNGEALLARRQQALARKQRGSNRRRRARRLVGKAHEHTASQRRDFHCKLAAQLCAQYDLIAVEALNVRGLARTNLAKSIHDAGWSQFLTRLSLKAEDAGVHVVAVDPRNTTRACADCGALADMLLGDRVRSCSCGAVRDRDHNAALNIEARGRRVLAASASAVLGIGPGRN